MWDLRAEIRPCHGNDTWPLQDPRSRLAKFGVLAYGTLFSLGLAVGLFSVIPPLSVVRVESWQFPPPGVRSDPTLARRKCR